MNSGLLWLGQVLLNSLWIGATGTLVSALPSLPAHSLAEIQAQASLRQEKAKPVGMDHLALLTTDIERYIEFYREFLGFPEMQRGNEVPNAPNVYYWRDGSPENLAKEKQGRLFMVKLWVGGHQALEFFPSRTPIAEGKNLHHLGIGFEDSEAVRQALLSVNAQAPSEPGTDLFYTYDKNISGTEIIEQKPRKAVERNANSETPADKAISTHLLFAEIPGDNMAELTRFYTETLGYRGNVGQAAPTETGPAEVRLDIGPDGEYVVLNPARIRHPRIGFRVKSLEAAREFLEKSPWRSNYTKPIQIGKSNGRRCIVLEDPEGVRVVLLEAA